VTVLFGFARDYAYPFFCSEPTFIFTLYRDSFLPRDWSVVCLERLMNTHVPHDAD